MIFFYSHRVSRALSDLGIDSLIVNLDTVNKIKKFGEKEAFWPKETATFIYYILPDDMKPQGSEMKIKLWLLQGAIRSSVLYSIKQMISSNEFSLTRMIKNASLENLATAYSINIPNISKTRIESLVISVAQFIAKESINRSGRNIDDLSQNERFIAMLICLVASNHLTRLTNISFEMLSAIACVDLDIRKGADFAELIVNYNRMANSPSESRVLETIGKHVVKFTSTGDSRYLDKLSKLYVLLMSNIKS